MATLDCDYKLSRPTDVSAMLMNDRTINRTTGNSHRIGVRPRF